MRTFNAYHNQSPNFAIGKIEGETFEQAAKNYKEKYGLLFRDGDMISSDDGRGYIYANNEIIFVDSETKEERVIDIEYI